MIFKTDSQTIRDLELFGERKNQSSVFSIYNCTKTRGGQDLLYRIFNSPVSDIEFLENRRDEIRFFAENDCRLSLNPRSVDYIEYYLNIRRVPLKANILDATVAGLSNKINPDNDYFVITESIIHIAQLLADLKGFIGRAREHTLTRTFGSHLEEVESFCRAKAIVRLIGNQPKKAQDLGYNQINKYDNYFRVKDKEAFRNLMTVVYEIDLLQSMAGLVMSGGFSLPEYVSSPEPVFIVSDSFHPFLDKPVRNGFEFKGTANLCFLTGPNMSGKSTFLKTMGLLVYISHCGLPVPAREFKTSVMGGLFSTINLADNINLGYSHFYAEVSRVKEIASLLLNRDRNLVIIFDELFRGTNVKDAFDASLGIIDSLSRIRNNFFFISTHILEVAENLGDRESILFRCFESELVNHHAVYDFRLKEGISSERVGMKILERENVMSILDKAIVEQSKKRKE
jgi:DNA mismatch repair ATPase MutS